MENTRKYKAVSLLLCALATPIAIAQDADFESGKWNFSGYTGQASIDSASALQEGVEDRAWIVGFSADYLQKNWVTSVGLDVTFYDDNQKFSQEVEGNGVFNGGDRSTESSTANGYLMYVASGYQWLFTEQQNLAVQLQGGYGHMLSSERSIGACTNCYSEDIDVNGGVFAKVTILHSGESVSFGAFLQQYFGDGVNTVFGITIASSF